MNWLSKRGPPLWLDDPRWYIRAMRVSLVLGILGFISASLTTVCFEVFVFSAYVAPGLWFGLITLIPLSRWIGRGWILTLLAVPVSMVASFCGVTVCAGFARMSSHVGGFFQMFAGSFFGGFFGALIVSAWMGNPKQTRSWIACLCATVLAALACGFSQGIYADASSRWGPHVVSALGGFVMVGLVFYAFQCVVPICLGARLWFPMPTRETTANKPDATGDSPSAVVAQ